MINSNLLNSSQLNWYLSFWIVNTDDIIFDNFSISGWFLRVSNLLIDDLSNIEINDYNNPQDNWGGVLSRYYRDRRINVNWVISWSSKEELTSLIDELKKRTKKKEWNLDIKFMWKYRRIKATAESITFDRQYYHITFVPFSLVFLCKEAFFRDVAYSETSFTGKTASFQEEVIVYWTTSCQSYTTMSFTSASSVTSVEMEVNWSSISYTGTVATNDVLTFDWENKRVLKNGVEVDYDWIFVDYQVDRNIVSFTINWTYNVDISCFYKNAYL